VRRATAGPAHLPAQVPRRQTWQSIQLSLTFVANPRTWRNGIGRIASAAAQPPSPLRRRASAVKRPWRACFPALHQPRAEWQPCANAPSLRRWLDECKVMLGETIGGYFLAGANVQEASEILGRAVREEAQASLHKTGQKGLIEVEPLVRDCGALDRGRERSKVIPPNTPLDRSSWIVRANGSVVRAAMRRSGSQQRSCDLPSCFGR
jgi:hypothetical protein